MAQLGEFAITYDGHCGFIEKIYRVTGVGTYVHIRESDGKIYYCPLSPIYL